MLLSHSAGYDANRAVSLSPYRGYLWYRRYVRRWRGRLPDHRASGLMNRRINTPDLQKEGGVLVEEPELSSH